MSDVIEILYFLFSFILVRFLTHVAFELGLDLLTIKVSSVTTGIVRSSSICDN